MTRNSSASISKYLVHFFPMAFVSLTALNAAMGQNSKPIQASPEGQAVPAFQNTQGNVAYVGSAVCANCHAEIAKAFQSTTMGQSISRPSDPRQLAMVADGAKVFDPKLGRYFQVWRKGGAIYQSEFALRSGKKLLFNHTEQIAYAVGGGINGYSYLVWRGNYLFQAPLSYYTRRRAWDLSPGHEFGFNRAILADCIACHSGRARPISDRDGLYHRPAFAEMSIGCENCHGPGQLHVQQRIAGKPVSLERDLSIVNPARLPGWLADNICMSCHQSGEAVVFQPGKSHLDFRPGLPLGLTEAIFKLPLSRVDAPESPLLDHYSLMIASECYIQSNGGLHCITCHDPHIQPKPEGVPADFRAQCLKCHSEESCSIALRKRLKQKPADNCVGCHMPRQALQTISHSALTSHRIVRRPDQPYPEAALRTTTSRLPGALELTAAPVPGLTPLPLRTRVLAYQELMRVRPSFSQDFEEALAQAATELPNDPAILGILAREAMAEGVAGRVKATGLLWRAIEAGSTWPPDYLLLGELLERAGKPAAAAQVLEHGLALAPYTPSLYGALAICYQAVGENSKALETAQEGAKLFPENDALRKLNKRLSAGAAAPAKAGP